jgi:hypothetical protein
MSQSNSSGPHGMSIDDHGKAKSSIDSGVISRATDWKTQRRSKNAAVGDGPLARSGGALNRSFVNPGARSANFANDT